MPLTFRPPPPTIALACLAIAYGLHLGIPTPLLAPPPWNLAGLVLVFAGLALGAVATVRFRAKDTTFHPWKEPNALVTEGPYRWSRNPMYVGLAVATLGLALLVGTAMMLLAPALFVAAMDRWVIPWEERTLVRRWL